MSEIREKLAQQVCDSANRCGDGDLRTRAKCQVVADAILAKFEVVEKKPRFSVSHGPSRVLIVDGSTRTPFAIADFPVYHDSDHQDSRTAAARAREYCDFLNAKEAQK